MSDCSLVKNWSTSSGDCGTVSARGVLCPVDFSSWFMLASILADHSPPKAKLTSRKGDLGFGIGSDAIARRRTEAPPADRFQHLRILLRPGALEDQRAVHVAVGSNDKTY